MGRQNAHKTHGPPKAARPPKEIVLREICSLYIALNWFELLLIVIASFTSL